MELNVIIAGRAGQGFRVGAELLGRAFVRGGYHVLATFDVMSRIRGGHNFSRVRIADRPVAADGDSADVLVALAPGLVESHVARLAPGAVVVTDDEHDPVPEGDFRVLSLPLTRLAREAGDERMANSVAAGAVVALTGFDIDLLAGALRQEFESRGEDVAAKNAECARKGYKAAARSKYGTVADLPKRDVEGGLRFLSGADALALGAIAGGARFATGYPTSPATALLETCARFAARTGMIVEQAEDEPAAINQACGAAFAGLPAMVVTSGGGLSLMNEGLSLAGMVETGVTVFCGMRPGPATGLATRTAQADLLFAVSCGHGEFPRAVLCPGDGAQALASACRAVRLAEKYQTPVIVLFDQYLADAFWTVGPVEFKQPRPARSWRGRPWSYRRYELTDSGVSPRLVPGTPNQLVYADSDEHTIEGHITESATMRDEMVAKRLRKRARLAGETAGPERRPDRHAAALACCFGSTRGAVREAVDRLRRKGMDIGMLHFSEVWPFPADRVRELTRRSRRLYTVEGNYSAQLAGLLAQECRLRTDGSVRRWDGRPLTVAEIERGLAELENPEE